MISKLREALLKADVLISIATFEEGVRMDEVDKIRSEIKAVISEPPRNCDVGTADEQANRFKSFCKTHLSGIRSICSAKCPCVGCRSMFHCLTKWEQMPYEDASEMKDYSNVRAVCFECSRKAGFVQKKKAVIVLEDECGICKARRPCTDLHHDWMQPKEESEVK